jgi:plasmid stability protein
MNITLKELPDTLHLKLKERAEANGRSLNKEVIAMLEAMVNPVRRNPENLLRRIAEHRAALPHLVKEAELPGIINEGRR